MHILKISLVINLSTVVKRSFCNDIFTDLDNYILTIAVFRDLSAAFDTVNHQELFNYILWFDLGKSRTVYNWFQDFLQGRQQQVCIDGKKC